MEPLGARGRNARQAPTWGQLVARGGPFFSFFAPALRRGGISVRKRASSRRRCRTRLVGKSQDSLEFVSDLAASRHVRSRHVAGLASGHVQHPTGLARRPRRVRPSVGSVGGNLPWGKMVGPTRFELVTSCTPSKRSTRLSHGPTHHRKHPSRNGTRNVPKPSGSSSGEFRAITGRFRGSCRPRPRVQAPSSSSRCEDRTRASSPSARRDARHRPSSSGAAHPRAPHPTARAADP